MTKKQLNRAGETLASSCFYDTEYEDALELINAWRSLHLKPLNTFQTGLKKKAVAIDIGFIFAQRLKKMKSIKEKLIRNPGMQLSRMQDIGGCRVVLSTLDQVYALEDSYCKSRIKHRVIRRDDYIKSPKKDGYRSLHLVFRYVSSNSEIDGLQVEVQLRTRLQHIWATAVETASLLSETPLKSGEGSEDWLHFFALASSCFAIQEGCIVVPDTPESIAEIRTELRALDSKNDFLVKFDALNAFASYADNMPDTFRRDYHLLYINKQERRFRAKGFKKAQYKQAYDEYVSWEKRENGVDNVVLVATNSLDSLRSAYPNYFADMKDFVATIRNVMD